MGSPETALDCYVPAFVRRQMATSGAAPWSIDTRGAVLFADISGSTALAERLAERGAAGAEDLGAILNRFFGVLIDVIERHGGDVIKFAGDGLFALWEAIDPQQLAGSAVIACRCGLAAHAALRRDLAPGASPLAMRIGIGAGDLTAMAVGGEKGAELALVGRPVQQACTAQHTARPGEVVASGEACVLIAGRATGSRLSDDAVRIEAVADSPIPRHLPGSAGDLHDRSAPEANGELRRFIPTALLPRLDAGQAQWLAELRYISALFVQLPDWSGRSLASVQEMIGAVHAAVDRYQGSILRLGLEAKGPVIKAAFGLPPHSHEDDAARAVHAALAIQLSLRALGHGVAIGVAAGRAFCAEVGNQRRREYTTVGAVVHRAARLMQAAGEGVLCDAATRDAAQQRIAFTRLDPLALKGMSEPVAVYRPFGRTSPAAPNSRRLLGRNHERAQLSAVLGELRERQRGRIVVVEAEAGFGKSCLVDDVVRQAGNEGITVLKASAEAIEANTPYHAWRAIVLGLLDIESLPAEPAARRLLLQAVLDRYQEGSAAAVAPARLLPLLNPILGCEAPDTEETAKLSGEARADATHELLLRLLERRTQASPVLLVFEDSHWLDSASWAVIEMVAARIQPLVLLLATRPMAEAVPPVYRRLLQDPAAAILRLAALSATETTALIADRLGARTVSEQVVRFVFERAGGHPFFVEELIRALIETRAVHISGDECRVSPATGDLDRLQLPHGIEATITGRMDILPARQQLLLKVASVLGRVFSAAAVRDIYPLAADRPHLDSDLRELGERELILPQTEGEPTYAFKHAIIRDVAYDRLAFVQRRQLHRSAAEWYEETQRQNREACVPLLAHHWSRAVDPQAPDPEIAPRALQALERAGEQAVRSYANAEAVAFFREALQLGGTLGAGDGTSERRVARWYRHLADAANRLGKIPEAIDYALQALRHLGQPFPAAGFRQTAGIARELLRQTVHRTAGVRWLRLAGAAQEAALEAAHLYELLGLMWYITLDSVPATLANLKAINLAERAGPSPELATSSAMIGLSAGVLLGPRYSEHYFRSGQVAAQQVGDGYGYGRICYTRGLVYTGDARWPEADAAYAEALRTFENIGEARWRDIARLMIAVTCFLRGRHAETQALYEQCAVSLRERGDVQAQAWLSVGLAGCLVAEGSSAAGLDALDRLSQWLANNLAHMADRGAELIAGGLRATSHFRQGHYDRALAVIRANLQSVREAPALTCYVLPGYSATAEVALRLWDEARVPAAEIEPLAAQALRDLRRYTRLYRLGRPTLALWSGLYLWLCGRPSRAMRRWCQALSMAREQSSPREEALADFEIGRHLRCGDAARRVHLGRALETFSKLGLQAEQRAAQAELGIG
jgi:class 3 adenylate cyclase/tetratricopeptide (TPR) repeat protein